MRLALLLFSVLVPSALSAGPPVIVDARAQNDNGMWRFEVSVAHDDTGWDHYADAWQIRGEDDTVLGTRELLHPHVNEQPFTRSLDGIVLPDDIQSVLIVARDSVHGWGEPVRLEIER